MRNSIALNLLQDDADNYQMGFKIRRCVVLKKQRIRLDTEDGSVGDASHMKLIVIGKLYTAVELGTVMRR